MPPPSTTSDVGDRGDRGDVERDPACDLGHDLARERVPRAGRGEDLARLVRRREQVAPPRRGELRGERGDSRPRTGRRLRQPRSA